MFIKRDFSFPPRAVLTRQIMDELRDFPKRQMTLCFDGYGDGILAGGDFRMVETGEVVFTRAILKLDKDFYFSEDDVNLTELLRRYFEEPGRTRQGKMMHFVLIPADSVIEGGIRLDKLQVVLVPLEESGWFELARIQDEASNEEDRRRSIRLPSNARELFCAATHLGIVGTKYACYGGNTFHPYVMRVLRNVLRDKKKLTSADIMLLMRLEENCVIPRGVLQAYIKGNVGDGQAQTDPDKLLHSIFEAAKREPEMVHHVEQKWENQDDGFENDDIEDDEFNLRLNQNEDYE